MKNQTRRHFLYQSIKFGAGLSMAPLTYACTKSKVPKGFQKKIVILGIDGMDPKLTAQFIREGDMPNFKHLMETGGFKEMRSSIPPQSPVAWSEFSIGASASVHGIFDFVHRDPKTMIPYFSTSQVAASDRTLPLGSWKIPLARGTARQLREGIPFWAYLGQAGIPTTIFKMPGEFPVKHRGVHCVSGMGTPDLLGSYGTFSFFTSRSLDNYSNVTGGTVIPVKIQDNKISTQLTGPQNTFRKGNPPIRIPLTIWRDPENEVVKIKLQDHTGVMKRGEWSNWVRLCFDYVPHIASVKGICRIYLKQVHPDFEMYISPVNIDPSDQSLPVTSPEEFGQELVNHAGMFNTKGLPADTKALSYGVLSDAEYLQVSGQILEESRKLFQYELSKLKSRQAGVLFYYFSNLDQDSHMFWRATDKTHPLYTPEVGQEYSSVIKKLYVEMDRVLGSVFKTFDIDDDNFRIIVMSDHGFAPFSRSVNLNTWLFYNGYIALYNNSVEGCGEYFDKVDWSRTKAYGLGINALYINKKGREKFGIVPEGDVAPLLVKLKKELLALKDPASGQSAISNIWLGKEIYRRDDDKVPDMVIGWNKGFRASWETVLGGFPEAVFTDNNDKWSGDHCIDPLHVPAVLMANKRIHLQNPGLPDVTATILAECNIPIPGHMTGKPLYRGI